MSEDRTKEYRLKCTIELTTQLFQSINDIPIKEEIYEIIRDACKFPLHPEQVKIAKYEIETIYTTLKLPEIIYAVPWIEIDFGQRDEGHQLYISLEDAKKHTIHASKKGAYGDGDGYYGPKRPLHCIEVPSMFLEEELKTQLQKSLSGRTMTFDIHWSPRFKGKTIYIKES